MIISKSLWLMVGRLRVFGCRHAQSEWLEQSELSCCASVRPSSTFSGSHIFKDYKSQSNRLKKQEAAQESQAKITNSKNVITVPLKLAERLDKKALFSDSKRGKRQKRIRISRRGSESRPIIICKRPEFNHYYGQSYPKLFRGGNKDSVIPLASDGWAHRKSVGDWFKIQQFAPNYALQFGEDHQNPPQTDFRHLGIHPQITQLLTTAGIHQPTLIQTKAIPVVLRGSNVVIASETGCGKTLCYALPMIQGIHTKTLARNWGLPPNSPLGIVLVPSRELVDQVHEMCRTFAEPLGLQTGILQGGNLGSKIKNPPSKLIHILVSTPNALGELGKMGVYSLNRVEWIVLDEADSLLDDSFVDDVLQVVQKFANTEGIGGEVEPKQFLLVSATMPKGIEEILNDSFPVGNFETITTPGLHRIMGHVPQDFYRLKKTDKPEKCLELVKKDVESGTNVMIFCNKFETCEWLKHYLFNNGIGGVVSLNGSLSTPLRKERIHQYLCGEAKVLVCTDIASRGIDTVETGHVINYDFPRFISDYIHRTGRTGRVGSRVEEGRVSSLVGWASEALVVQKIERSIRKDTDLKSVDGNIKKQLNVRYGYGQGKPILAIQENKTETQRDQSHPQHDQLPLNLSQKH